jgi:hypothetical protein
MFECESILGNIEVYNFIVASQIHFNFNSKKTITKINDNINIDITIGRSINV